MDILSVAKQSWKLLWTNKYLWFFGFFVAGAGGAGGNPGAARGGSGQPVPGWVWPLVALAAVLGLVGLGLHLLSEAALIEGARRGQASQPFGIRQGLSFGLRFVWRVLAVKALAVLAALVGVAIVGAPIGLGVAKVLPLGVGALFTALLALLAVPAALTGYFLYQYALRFVVLEGAPATDAVRAAASFVHGRLVPSLLLLLAASASSFVAGAAGLLAALPAAAIGLGLYFAAGLVPALVVGVAVFLPFAVPLAGASGAFRSTVWTVGFLDARRAA